MKRLITIVCMLAMSSPLYAFHQNGQRPRAVSAASRGGLGHVKAAWGTGVSVLARVKSLNAEAERKSNQQAAGDEATSRPRAVSTGARAVATASVQALFQQQLSRSSSALSSLGGAGASSEPKKEAASSSADVSRARAFSAGAGAAVESKKEEFKKIDRPKVREAVFSTETHLAFFRMFSSWMHENKNKKLEAGETDYSDLVNQLWGDIRFDKVSVIKKAEGDGSIPLEALEKDPNIMGKKIIDSLEKHAHVVISIPNSKFISEKLIRQMVKNVQQLFPGVQLAGDPIKQREKIRFCSRDGLRSITIMFLKFSEGHTISFFNMELFDTRLGQLSGQDFFLLQKMVIADTAKEDQPTDCVFGAIERAAIEKRWATAY